MKTIAGLLLVLFSLTAQAKTVFTIPKDNADDSRYLTAASPNSRFILQGCGNRQQAIASMHQECGGNKIEIYDTTTGNKISIPIFASGYLLVYGLTNTHLFLTMAPMTADGYILIPPGSASISRYDLSTGKNDDFLELPANSYCASLGVADAELLCALNRFDSKREKLESAKLVMWDAAGKQTFVSPELSDGSAATQMIRPDLASFKSDVLILSKTDLGGGVHTSDFSYLFNPFLKTCTVSTRAPLTPLACAVRT